MKFYNREIELLQLEKIEKKSQQNAQMTFVVGRRRIGKTSLLLKAVSDKKFIYFFVAKKNETLLCNEFVEEIKLKLKIEVYGTFKTFKEVFGYLMELSKNQHFTVVIDEFQEFNSVNKSVYSDMQHIWDTQKEESKINLILCGSVYSLMKQIFEQSKEPLFGRANNRLHLKAFSIKTLKEIFTDYNPSFCADDLLAFYMITGGVAKYVELLIQAEAFTLNSIMDNLFSENSLFIEEGKNVLIDEFGKDYGNYFSILSLIASSKTSRVDMESILEMPIGGFLERLEVDFGLISKVRPLFSKPNSRSVKYLIKDNFLNFWFRFIYKYRSAIEMGNLNYVKDIVIRDYQTYSGRVLEKYFTEKLKEEGKYSAIGSSWKKGNTNEIDIVAINEREKKLLFAEVKRNPEKIKIDVLKEKSISIMNQFKDFEIFYKEFSLEDM